MSLPQTKPIMKTVESFVLCKKFLPIKQTRRAGKFSSKCQSGKVGLRSCTRKEIPAKHCAHGARERKQLYDKQTNVVDRDHSVRVLVMVFTRCAVQRARLSLYDLHGMVTYLHLKGPPFSSPPTLYI